MVFPQPITVKVGSRAFGCFSRARTRNFKMSTVSETSTTSTLLSITRPAQATRSLTTSAINRNIFHSPFYSLTHCDHCYPESPNSNSTLPNHHEIKATFKPARPALSASRSQPVLGTNDLTSGESKADSIVNNSYGGKENSGPRNLSTNYQHQQARATNPTFQKTKMSDAPVIQAKPAPKPRVPGQGILVPASKVHTATKTELLQTLSLPEFNDGEGRVPKLVGILATGKEDAENYAEFTRKSCAALGIEYELRRVGEARKDHGDQPGVEIGVEEAILEANDEEGVDGIMVYYPIHGGSRDQYLQQCVSPLKDVEGLHHQFLFNLYHNIRHISPSTLRPIPASHLPESTATSATEDPAPIGTVKSVLPCTPLAIVKVLEFVGVYNKLLEWGDRARGKVITVINRSEVVGRPLAALLSNDGARVLSVDIDSIVEFSKRPSTASENPYNPHHIMTPLPSDFTLKDALAVSDVVISAVPSKNYKVKTEWLKDGCICVNVAGDKNFESDVRDKASIYVPSVGQMTIAMLQRNLLRLRNYRNMIADAGSKESAF